MRKEEFFEVIGGIDDCILEEAKTSAKGNSLKKPVWVKWGVLAACLSLTMSLTVAAFAAEAKEYGTAVTFFDENGLSIEGLSRSEVKAVYRDITSQHFTFDKTADVIERAVPGLEIDQRQPTPEELTAIWNLNIGLNSGTGAGISYIIDNLYKPDDVLGFDVLDKGILKCCHDGELSWTAEFPELVLEDSVFTSAGTAVWGRNYTWSSEQASYPWLARVDEAGKILWQHRVEHGFEHEYISSVLDNGDGTWAVISRGDLSYLCLSQYDTDGNELSFKKTEVGNKGIWNAARLGEGYLVQLGNKTDGEAPRLCKLDRNGNLLESFTYEAKDCDYHIIDMIEFGETVFLSAYAVPKQTDGGGRHEIANILDHVFGSGNYSISGEELTPMVQDNYTAVLLLCSPEGGEPQTFYSVKASLGGKLSLSEGGKLIWDVESIVDTFFSPATNSFTIGGRCRVFRYTFDSFGALISQEDTGETSIYSR